MEAAFGADLGAVRLHTGPESAALNRSLGAQAFTYGSDIYFGEGQTTGGGADRTRLLAHELAHVVQQGGGRVRRFADGSRGDLRVGRSHDSSEVEAERTAADVVSALARNEESRPVRIRRSSSAMNARTVRRMPIPATVTGLDFGIDTSSRADFAAAVKKLYNESVLLEVKGLIEADLKTAGISEVDSESDTLALGLIGDRLKALGVSRRAWKTAAEPGRVKPDDPDYAKYKVKESFDMAERLIDTAVAKLSGLSPSTPASDPVMKTFRSFFATAHPRLIASRLQDAKAQIKHFRPHAPPGDFPAGGGHACLDSTYPGVQYLDQGVAAEARLIIGVKALSMTPGARAYNVIHEATHGAPELRTVDLAYRWQRLFPYLQGDDQLNNADSYGMLVGFLCGLTSATTGMSDAVAATYDLDAPGPDTQTNGLSPDVDRAIKTSWAWFEYYATQCYVNYRDLLTAVEGPDPLIANSYQEKLFNATATIFPLGANAPAVIQQLRDYYDRMVKYAAFQAPLFVATMPATPTGGAPALMVPAALGTDVKALTMWHLREWGHQKSLAAAIKNQYERLLPHVVKTSAWTGPLSK
jgi:hypothetical protein